MKKDIFKNIKAGDLVTVGLGIVTAVSAFIGTMSDHKKDKEFEEMKKAVAELTKKD